MRRLKLLYAEDEKNIRENITNYISKNYNFDIYQASDGEEAYEIYQKCNPDIIITDITMPKLCGLTLIEKIRQKDTETKIIVISGHDDQDKLLKAIELNLISYQIKPINRDKLNSSLEKAIDTINSIQSDNKHFFNDDIYFDIEKNILINDNKTIELTTSETKLLILFINNIDKTISSENLFYHLWDYDKKYSQTAVRTMIKKLRQSLPKNSIENVYGEGYKLKYTKW